MKKTLLLFLLFMLNINMICAQDYFCAYYSDGSVKFFPTLNADSISLIIPKPSSVTDICGNTYQVVQIGCQYWMAENLKCNKYDTKSELAGKEITGTPYSLNYEGSYKDATDKSNWTETTYAKNLTNEDVKKLGYSYSWAAAVGLLDGRDFDGKELISGSYKRQGICPNGFHIPTIQEWSLLAEEIGGVRSGESYSNGLKLKSKRGWYNNANGTDDYSLTMLPAGWCKYNMEVVGQYAGFWTSTSVSSVKARLVSINESIQMTAEEKNYGVSVRCVKD